MHKQHPQTAYRKYAILIGTIFENCDKSSTIREAIKLLSSKGIVERQQVDEEAAPAHDPNLKNSKAPERYAPGPAVIFYGKKSCFSGVLRVLSICGDYDEAHRCLLSVNGQSTKCSAYVADVSGFFACQLICIRSVLAQNIIHHIMSLSGCSDLIGNNCSAPNKAACFIFAALIEPKNLHDWPRKFIAPIPLCVPLRLGQRSDSFCHRLFIRPGLKGVILGQSGCN